jgi:hypothetical protein
MILTMALSFEEFRAALLHTDGRAFLGIQLTDAEAQHVHDDPASAQSWYSYWLTTPAGQAPPATPYATAPIAPLGDHDLTRIAPSAAGAYAGVYPSAPAPTDTVPRKKNVGLWVTLSIVGALVLIAIIVVVVAFTTARHWTKVDAPEKPETFHSEEYETGLYLVSDDGVSPCVVDQDWTDCIAAMEVQYAGACADVELVPDAVTLCAQHRAEIDRMISEDSEGTVVASLGDFGHLTRSPETATREVSNNDYEPAVTHEAVCYLGFLGECE